MTKTPGTPQYPNRRPKKHEHGILTFTAATQSWLPLPTPEQARERFEAFVRGWRTNLPRTTQTTARLIVHGEVAAEVELQGERIDDASTPSGDIYEHWPKRRVDARSLTSLVALPS
jgi:hypothetical protein